MVDKIKPGEMGDASDPTQTPKVFADSMAAEIEHQLVELLKAEGLPAPNTDDNSKESRDRRMLFVAIARGIVKHLDLHRTAIEIDVTPGRTVSPTFVIKKDEYGKDWP